MLFRSREFFNLYKYKRKLCYIFRKFSNTLNAYDNVKILFFGTDTFSLPSLKALHIESQKQDTISSIAVVTSINKHSNPVRSYAATNHLEIFKWPLPEEVAKAYDLGVVVSFGHLIPGKLISVLPLGIINVHASLLPRWRGAAPIIHALLHQDKTTGVSIMKIEPKHFDRGDILAQREIPIKPDMFLDELHSQLATLGANLLTEIVSNVPRSLETRKKQDEHLVTYAPKLQPTQTEIKWSELTAQEVYTMYRAFYSYKNLTTRFHDYTIKVVELFYNQTSTNNFPAGFVHYCKNTKCLRVYCKDNSFVDIVKLKVEGKKVMNATEFNNGFLIKWPKNDRYFK